MEIDITVGDGPADARGGGAAESAASLRRWLTAEPELRGHATVSAASGQQGPPGQGHMGGALDVVNVVLANSIALGSLITAVAGWRGSRPRPPRITLERDGVVVTLHDSSPETVERILSVWNETSAAGTSGAVAPGPGASGPVPPGPPAVRPPSPDPGSSAAGGDSE